MKNRETFNFYRSFFDSASEAKKDGFNQGHISAVCMGNEKKHKGYIWRYISKEDYINIITDKVKLNNGKYIAKYFLVV